MGFCRCRSLPLPVLPELPPTPLLLLLLVVLPPRLWDVVASVIIEWLRLMSLARLPAAPLLVAVDAIEPPLPGPPPPVPLPAALAPPAEAPPVLPLAPFPFCCCDFIIDGADADDDGVEDAVTDVAAVGDCGEETEVEPLPRRKASRSSSVWWERDFVFTPGAGLAPDEGPILWKYSIPAAEAPPPPPPAPPAPL